MLYLMPKDKNGEPNLSPLDQAPQPATPEELKEFHELVMDKVSRAGMAGEHPDPITGEESTHAMWVLGENLAVHAQIGATHEPEAVEILVVESFGLVNDIDTEIQKHFRYFPNAEVSEFNEELVERNSEGRRLIGEELQRALELLPEVSQEELDEAKRLAIEHARKFMNEHGASNLPPLDKYNLDEVKAVLDRCNRFSERRSPLVTPRAS
jgi:hypothetical protein